VPIPIRDSPGPPPLPYSSGSSSLTNFAESPHVNPGTGKCPRAPTRFFLACFRLEPDGGSSRSPATEGRGIGGGEWYVTATFFSFPWPSPQAPRRRPLSPLQLHYPSAARPPFASATLLYRPAVRSPATTLHDFSIRLLPRAGFNGRGNCSRAVEAAGVRVRPHRHARRRRGVGMGLLSNRVERSEIRPGDHIYTWRAVYAYSHHGTLIDPLPMVPHEF